MGDRKGRRSSESETAAGAWVGTPDTHCDAKRRCNANSHCSLEGIKVGTGWESGGAGGAGTAGESQEG
eukprot:3208368-Rhodomonas_salina.1